MQSKAKLYRFRARSPGPLFATRSCLLILFINWLMQGMRGMDMKELSFRLILLALGAIGGGLVGWWMTGWPPAATGASALLLAHSLNFLVNGQLWVCLRYCPGYHRHPAHLRQQCDQLFERIAACPWLDEAVVIGSAASHPGKPGPHSDIDLRLVFPPGPGGWLKTNLLLLELRARALITRLPLDIYAYAHPSALRRFDQNEPLGILLDRAARLRRGFANRTLVWLR